MRRLFRLLVAEAVVVGGEDVTAIVLLLHQHPVPVCAATTTLAELIAEDHAV